MRQGFLPQRIALPEPPIMNILGWLILGFFAGLLARLLVPGPTDFKGCLPTIVLGMVGAVVGGFIGQQLNIQGWHFLLSILGAVLVLVIYQAAFGRRRM
jgi:uncharacterized membrane protein YeaQ/YmgE (transglycosylase-associated protein family)